MTFKNVEMFRHTIEEAIPFNKYVGVKLHDLEVGRCALLLPFSPDLIGDAQRMTFHGGVLSMLVATCGSFAVWSTCSPEDKIVTIDMGIDFLRPVPAGDLIAEARIRHVGRRVGNAHTVIYPLGEPDNVLAEGRSVYSIRRCEQKVTSC